MAGNRNVGEISRDAIVVAIGVALVLSTIWLPADGDQEVTGAVLILGMLAAGCGLWAMGGASRPSHWMHLIIGVILVVAPLLLAFPRGVQSADIIVVVGGAIIAVIGVVGVLAHRSKTSTQLAAGPRQQRI